MKLSLVDNKKFVTKLGGYLRKTKIDELPQIFNIFIGQMSFVGPRPLYPEYNARYSKVEKLRLNVKPGITGLAQINVIDNDNWKSKFKYDVFYVKHKSFAFDLYILCKTFKLYFELLTDKKQLKENHQRFKE